MKKFFFLACLFMAAICAQAQSASLVVRTGNKYVVDSRTYNKKEFCRYIDGRDMQAYQKFKSGMRVANAGWGLFATGGALNIAGMGMIIGGGIQAGLTVSEDGSIKPEDIATKMTATMAGGVIAIVVGSLLQTTSIICLGVGYGRMHNAADMYNVSVHNHFRAELRPSSTGLGLALAW